MNRRGFLTGMAGILAAGYSASVLPSGVIMPVKALLVPKYEVNPSGMEILMSGGYERWESFKFYDWELVPMDGTKYPLHMS
jgi:hypothetical protein